MAILGVLPVQVATPTQRGDKMRTLTLIVTLLFAPLPALALSCLPHGVTDAYLQAAEAEEGYVPVLGTLRFDPDMLPVVDMQNQQDTPAQTLIPATFSGDALGPRGVPRPFETDVVLEVLCFGPWCPSVQPGQALAFLRQTSHSYVLSTNACGGFLFAEPTKAQVRQVRDCLGGRQCDPLASR